jgi:NAD(P)-dependent dehydrogenase (short-subunit alcohol dehydrogenase family)
VNLRERVALVTGAAGGIGHATCVALARRGCHVALVDRDAAGLADAAAAVEALGVRSSSHVLDVADRAAIAALPAQVLAAHGRVDVLVNNAGVALMGTFEQVSAEDFDWLIAVNFEAVVRVTRAFLPLLRARDAARIVNLSSVFGLIAPPEQTAYSASKFAVRGFSEALRHELAGGPVGVTVVHPGGVATAIARDARVGAGVDADVVRQRRALARTALRLPADEAGEIIVRGIERDRDRVLVGRDAQLIAWVARLWPVSYWKLLGRFAPR